MATSARSRERGLRCTLSRTRLAARIISWTDRIVGLYTIVEQVDNAFLKSRFQTKKGLLLKPEGVVAMDYFGSDWDAYAPLYRPDDEPLVSQAKRIIEFARLVHRSDDENFRSEIGGFDRMRFLNTRERTARRDQRWLVSIAAMCARISPPESSPSWSSSHDFAQSAATFSNSSRSSSTF